jgi:hypothetical protein
MLCYDWPAYIHTHFYCHQETNWLAQVAQVIFEKLTLSSGTNLLSSSSDGIQKSGLCPEQRSIGYFQFKWTQETVNYGDKKTLNGRQKGDAQTQLQKYH